MTPRHIAVQQARRIVVKIGSSSLTREDGGLDLNRIDSVARLVSAKARRGCEILIVSSGAVAAGLEPLGLSSRPKDLASVRRPRQWARGISWRVGHPLSKLTTSTLRRFAHCSRRHAARALYECNVCTR